MSDSKQTQEKDEKQLTYLFATHVLKCDGLDRTYKFLYVWNYPKNDTPSEEEAKKARYSFPMQCHAVVFRKEINDDDKEKQCTEFLIYPSNSGLYNINTLWLLEKLISMNSFPHEYSGHGSFDTRTPGCVYRKGNHTYMVG